LLISFKLFRVQLNTEKFNFEISRNFRIDFHLNLKSEKVESTVNYDFVLSDGDLFCHYIILASITHQIERERQHMIL
jgi:hypothetical protein